MNSEEYYDNIELENVDTDLEMVESEHIDTDLDIAESNSFIVDTDNSNCSEISQLATISQHKKRIRKLGGSSSVRPFYEVTLVNDIDYWICHHKSCAPRVKYKKDGTTSNLWRHLRNKHHILRNMMENNRVRIEQKDLDPQASTLSNDQLKEILINAENRVLQNMHKHVHDNNEICYASFTTDMWTSDNNNPYIDKIVEILDKFQVRSKVVCSTIDNGANIKSCLGKLEERYNIFKNFCFGHTLHLAINDALKKSPKIIDLIKKCKEVVYKSFLVEDNESGSLKSYEEKELSSEEWEKVVGLVELLRPYEFISTQLSGSHYPTQAWFAIHYIKLKIDNVLTSNISIFDIDVKNFGNYLLESIKIWFLEPTKLIRLAAFFDPWTKDMQIFSDDEKRLTILEAHMKYNELDSNNYEFNE
ncbi:5677_t:CDS:2, partial [Racocetra fulgida]